MPLPVLVLAAALLPLAAGLGVVLWSKQRAAARARRIERLELDLGRMYRALESAPPPAGLTATFEALEAADELMGRAQLSARPARAEGAPRG